MDKTKQLKLNQSGVVHLFLILFLLAAIAGTTYLVQQRTHILPFASDDTNDGNGDPSSNDNNSGLEAEGEVTSGGPADTEGNGGGTPADVNGGGGGAPADNTGGTGNGTGAPAEADHGGYETAQEAQTSMQGSWEAYQADIADGKPQDQIDASRGAYEAAAGAYESFGFEASGQAVAVADASGSVYSGELSVEAAIAGHENALGPDGIAAVFGSIVEVAPEEAGRQAVEYAVSHGYPPETAAGMGAIAAQTAGGTAQGIMDASVLGEHAITGEYSVAGAFATGSYLGLDQQTIAEYSAGIAQAHGLTAEQFAAQAASSQLSNEQLQGIYESVVNGNTAALAATIEAERTAQLEAAIGPNTATTTPAGPQQPAGQPVTAPAPQAPAPVAAPPAQQSNPTAISAGSTLAEQGITPGNYTVAVGGHPITDATGQTYIEGVFEMKEVNMQGRSVSYSIAPSGGPGVGESVQVGYLDGNTHVGGAFVVSDVNAPNNGFNSIGQLEQFVSENKDKIGR